MKQAGNLFIFLIILLTGFTSCDSGRVFDKYLEIPGAAWHKDSLVVFDVPVEDTLQNHNLLIQIRNKTSYPYSNLWLFVEITQPGGKVQRDTFEIVLADPAGRWLGKGFGGVKTLQSVYRRNVYFPISGEYKISLQQGMRDDVLKGIHDIGFRVEKVVERGKE
ncbi:gliding motility lipoprotein GldH [Mariniphaga sediminis]|uniref:Gliding motility lipoprotein GldH n=1 Tax=Mariniphaga sediminis TaxID=1628158 RepID=A0A399D666_9BACT|nr:gliding motility lipoprotein GldH [Mariniphaga sediminis]RIH65920.1 gliding motility lipoprotein GldH [Mariniphaga sediminis]